MLYSEILVYLISSAICQLAKPPEPYEPPRQKTDLFTYTAHKCRAIRLLGCAWGKA